MKKKMPKVVDTPEPQYKVKAVRFNRTLFPGQGTDGEVMGYVPCIVRAEFIDRLGETRDFYLCRAVQSNKAEVFYLTPEDAMAYYNSLPALLANDPAVIENDFGYLLRYDYSVVKETEGEQVPEEA